MVARCVRDAEALGSSPSTPTINREDGERFDPLHRLFYSCRKTSPVTAAARGLTEQYIPAFSADHPGITVGIIEGTSSRLALAVENHEADFCIISRREDDFDWIPLVEDEMIIWVPEDHPLAGGKHYPLSHLTQDPFIEIFPGETSDNSLFLQKLGIHPNSRYTVTTAYAASQLTAAGLGVTMVNPIYANLKSDGVTALRPIPELKVPIGIAMPKKSELSPAAETLP